MQPHIWFDLLARVNALSFAVVTVDSGLNANEIDRIYDAVEKNIALVRAIKSKYPPSIEPMLSIHRFIPICLAYRWGSKRQDQTNIRKDEQAVIDAYLDSKQHEYAVLNFIMLTAKERLLGHRDLDGNVQDKLNETTEMFLKAVSILRAVELRDFQWSSGSPRSLTSLDIKALKTLEIKELNEILAIIEEERGR